MLRRAFILAYNGSFSKGDNDRALEVIGSGTPDNFDRMIIFLSNLVENAGGYANNVTGPVNHPIFVEWDQYDHRPYRSDG